MTGHFGTSFDAVKNREDPGYPHFQGRNRYTSFTYPDGAGWKLDGHFLHLTKIGRAKVTLHRPLEGAIKTVTIKREVDEWYVSFSCDVPALEKLPVSDEEVGVDLGVTHLATLSTGEMIEHPRYYRKAKKLLAKRQQALARKKRGSHRREKVRKLVAKVHRKIARQRKDFQHKASKQLIERYQFIVFEDIKTSHLTRKPKPRQDETGAYLPGRIRPRYQRGTKYFRAWKTPTRGNRVEAPCL